MADGEQDQEQKTEDPTPKRLEEALKKGNVAVSREVSSFFILLVLVFTIAWFAPYMMHSAKMLFLPLIGQFEVIPTDEKGIGQILWRLSIGGLIVMVAPLVATIIAALAAGLIQNGFIFSLEPIIPKLEKISPLAGLKKMFSLRSVVEFIKSVIKIIIVGCVTFIAVYPEMDHLRQLPNSSLEALLLFLSKLSLRMALGAVIAMFFIAILDTLYQRWQHNKSLRMSRQEIKDEYKQSEGDPMVKSKLRRLRMERVRKRMMASVPEADVVITNPTHYSVALKYDTTSMKAPKVIAKGQDLIALKIREIAKEHDVPIVQNPPLARALFNSTDIDEEIPAAHYEAVAKVISYIYGLKGKKTRI